MCLLLPRREFSFKSLPLPGPDVPLRVAVWSDVGQSNVSLITAQEMANSNADVNLLAGDLRWGPDPPPPPPFMGPSDEPPTLIGDLEMLGTPSQWPVYSSSY